MPRTGFLLAVAILAGYASGSSDMFMYIPFQSKHDKSKGRTCYVTADQQTADACAASSTCGSGDAGTSVFQLYIAAVSSSSSASLTLLLRSPLRTDERRQLLEAQGRTGRAAVCVQTIDDAGHVAGRACAEMDAGAEALDAGVPVVYPLPDDAPSATHLLHLWVDHALSAAPAAGNRAAGDAPCCGGDATDVYFATDLNLPAGGAQVLPLPILKPVPDATPMLAQVHVDALYRPC